MRCCSAKAKHKYGFAPPVRRLERARKSRELNLTVPTREHVNSVTHVTGQVVCPAAIRPLFYVFYMFGASAHLWRRARGRPSCSRAVLAKTAPPTTRCIDALQSNYKGQFPLQCRVTQKFKIFRPVAWCVRLLLYSMRSGGYR